MGAEVDRSRDDAAGASSRPTHTPAIFARGLFRPRQAEPDRAAVPNLVWMRKRSAARRAHPLTERECLVLDRIGRDRTHKDIAAELGVSINTVANMAPTRTAGSARTAPPQRCSPTATRIPKRHRCDRARRCVVVSPKREEASVVGAFPAYCLAARVKPRRFRNRPRLTAAIPSPPTSA